MNRFSSADAAEIRRALATLPSRCKYHGADIERDDGFAWHREGACCDTGVSSVRRKRAESALERMLAVISGAE